MYGKILGVTYSDKRWSSYKDEWEYYIDECEAWMTKEEVREWLQATDYEYVEEDEQDSYPPIYPVDTDDSSDGTGKMVFGIGAMLVGAVFTIWGYLENRAKRSN